MHEGGGLRDVETVSASPIHLVPENWSLITRRIESTGFPDVLEARDVNEVMTRNIDQKPSSAPDPCRRNAGRRNHRHPIRKDVPRHPHNSEQAERDIAITANQDRYGLLNASEPDS